MNDARINLSGFDSVAYFRNLTERNRLCRDLGFRFGQCAGLQGFYDALAAAGSAPNFISVDDSSDGYFSLSTSPKIRTVKTIFISMRHKVGDMNARQYCLDQMREIFRQFLSHLIREKVRLEESAIEIDQNIQFAEIDSAFFTGAACAHFSVAVDMPQQLCFNPDEWV